MSYQALASHYRRLSHMAHVEAIVSWDEGVMMPRGGGEARAEALATLRVIAHDLATAPELGDLFAAAEANRGELSEWEGANLREMKRLWVREACLPAALVAATSRAESRCEQAWRVLRPKNDWEGLRPLLGEVVARKREVAAAMAAQLDLSPYDALLDGFEPGVRCSDIDHVFDDLGAFLPGFIQRALEHQRGERVIVPRGPFPIDRQRGLGIEVMKQVGFDFDHGRLDVSPHPFCGGVPTDVRITTRYDEADFTKSLMSVLHESGHAKYEQNLPRAWLDQPVGRARSAGLHESQSLLQEMQASRSLEHLAALAPLVAAAFPEAAAQQPEAFTPENLHRIYTRIRPDFIRVDADEATYPCHIILRYRIERPLIEGKLEVNDIPDAWDAGMRALLGLSTAGNYRNGCLQDVHWPAGAFGYFPSYTLGTVAAAQIFAAARRACPTLGDEFHRGDLDSLNRWLREKIWSRGSFLSTEALLIEATGAPLGTEAFKRHLAARYLAS